MEGDHSQGGAPVLTPAAAASAGQSILKPVAGSTTLHTVGNSGFLIAGVPTKKPGMVVGVDVTDHFAELIGPMDADTPSRASSVSMSDSGGEDEAVKAPNPMSSPTSEPRARFGANTGLGVAAPQPRLQIPIAANRDGSGLALQSRKPMRAAGVTRRPLNATLPQQSGEAPVFGRRRGEGLSFGVNPTTPAKPAVVPTVHVDLSDDDSSTTLSDVPPLFRSSFPRQAPVAAESAPLVAPSVVSAAVSPVSAMTTTSGVGASSPDLAVMASPGSLGVSSPTSVASLKPVTHANPLPPITTTKPSSLPPLSSRQSRDVDSFGFNSTTDSISPTDPGALRRPRQTAAEAMPSLAHLQPGSGGSVVDGGVVYSAATLPKVGLRASPAAVASRAPLSPRQATRSVTPPTLPTSAKPKAPASVVSRDDDSELTVPDRSVTAYDSIDGTSSFVDYSQDPSEARTAALSVAPEFVASRAPTAPLSPRQATRSVTPPTLPTSAKPKAPASVASRDDDSELTVPNRSVTAYDSIDGTSSFVDYSQDPSEAGTTALSVAPAAFSSRAPLSPRQTERLVVSPLFTRSSAHFKSLRQPASDDSVASTDDTLNFTKVEQSDVHLYAADRDGSEFFGDDGSGFTTPDQSQVDDELLDINSFFDVADGLAQDPAMLEAAASLKFDDTTADHAIAQLQEVFDRGRLLKPGQAVGRKEYDQATSATGLGRLRIDRQLSDEALAFDDSAKQSNGKYEFYTDKGITANQRTLPKGRAAHFTVDRPTPTSVADIMATLAGLTDARAKDERVDVMCSLLEHTLALSKGQLQALNADDGEDLSPEYVEDMESEYDDPDRDADGDRSGTLDHAEMADDDQAFDPANRTDPANIKRGLLRAGTDHRGNSIKQGEVDLDGIPDPTPTDGADQEMTEDEMRLMLCEQIISAFAQERAAEKRRVEEESKAAEGSEAASSLDDVVAPAKLDQIFLATRGLPLELAQVAVETLTKKAVAMSEADQSDLELDDDSVYSAAEPSRLASASTAAKDKQPLASASTAAKDKQPPAAASATTAKDSTATTATASPAPIATDQDEEEKKKAAAKKAQSSATPQSPAAPAKAASKGDSGSSVSGWSAFNMVASLAFIVAAAATGMGPLGFVLAAVWIYTTRNQTPPRSPEELTMRQQEAKDRFATTLAERGFSPATVSKAADVVDSAAAATNPHYAAAAQAAKAKAAATASSAAGAASDATVATSDATTTAASDATSQADAASTVRVTAPAAARVNPAVRPAADTSATVATGATRAASVPVASAPDAVRQTAKATEVRTPGAVASAAADPKAIAAAQALRTTAQSRRSSVTDTLQHHTAASRPQGGAAR